LFYEANGAFCCVFHMRQHLSYPEWLGHAAYLKKRAEARNKEIAKAQRGARR
jgi:hypothetical protein